MIARQRAQIRGADIEEVINVPWSDGDSGIRFRYEDALGRVARACPVVPREWFLAGELFAAERIHTDAERLEVAAENMAALFRSRGPSMSVLIDFIDALRAALAPRPAA